MTQFAALSSSRSAKHWQKDTYQPNVDIDFQPNRSLTKTLEQAAVNESSLSHNLPSFISTSSNSRTRLDLDELDDELHRVARLDRNLDIVRQQVRAILVNVTKYKLILTDIHTGSGPLYTNSNGVQ